MEVKMLKKLLELSMVALIVIAAAGAYFKWVGALPISVTQTQKMSTFDVNGEGKIVIAPDQAVINMGVVEDGTNLKQVQENVNKKMSDLAKSLKSLGVDEKDIKTTSYNFYPDYQYKNQFHAQASLAVTVRDLDQVSSAMDLITTLGLDNVSGPMFTLSDELMNKTVKEARGLAIEKAKAKAEELSGLAGMKLGRIVNISEGGATPPNFLMRDAVAPAAMGGEAKVATPIEPGSNEVSVVVTLSYETR